jgi:hypothetical protein
MLSEFAVWGGAGFVAQRGYSTPGETVAGGSFLSRYGSGSGTADLANQNLPAGNGFGGLGSRRVAGSARKIRPSAARFSEHGLTLGCPAIKCRALRTDRSLGWFACKAAVKAAHVAQLVRARR